MYGSLDFRRFLVSGLQYISPYFRGRSASSFPEQRLVIEATRMEELLFYTVKSLPVNSRASRSVSLSEPVNVDLVTELASVAVFR